MTDHETRIRQLMTVINDAVAAEVEAHPEYTPADILGAQVNCCVIMMKVVMKYGASEAAILQVLNQMRFEVQTPAAGIQ